MARRKKKKKEDEKHRYKVYYDRTKREGESWVGVSTKNSRLYVMSETEKAAHEDISTLIKDHEDDVRKYGEIQ